MTLATIISILFLAAGLFLLVFMLRTDVLKIQELNYDNGQFYDWITTTDEYLTVRRILALVIFIASVTTMAIDSHFVVAALAIGVVALGVSVVKSDACNPFLPSKRAWRLFAVMLAFMLAVIVGVALTTGLYYAGVAAVFFSTFSYAFTLAFNWLMIPVENRMGGN